MHLLVTAYLLAIAPLAHQTEPRDAAAIVAALEGTWTITHVNGKALSSVGQKSSITFTRTTYSVTTNGEFKERGTFRIHGTALPMQIDMRMTEGIAPGITQAGILRVANGTLALKTNTIGSPERPTDFKADPRYVLFIAQKN